MRHWFYTNTGGLASAGLLLLRLVMGTAFILHGWSKIQTPLGWMGPEAAVPAILQALASLAEFGGGMGLIVGFLTRIASLGIGSVMVVALTIVHLPQGQPFVSKGGPSCELPAVYLACAVLFLLSGPGRFSLDALLFGRPIQPKSHGPE